MILGNGIRAGSSLTALFLVALAAFAQVASDATQQGNKLLEESKPAEAVALFQRALSENPRDADALRGMGKAQEWLGHFPEAVASYRQAVAVEPNDAGTWFALGRVQSWQGERETAYESFEKALLLNPNNLEIELAYAEVLSWNPSRRQESLSRYQRILQQWPESVSAQLGLAQAQAWSGLTSQAEQTYDTVLRQESNNPQALLGKSQIARWEMRLFTAHDLLLQAIRAAPSNPQVLRALAETEIDLGQYDLARERANQLAGLAPDDSQQVEEQIRQAQRPFFETGYQLRRDRKSPIQTRLSWDAFQSVLSVPVTSRMRWRFAFR
ncbi:MAG: tetratricopeptide repeat protein, partial [Acidobacteria bacterium]|nr:tetratricopeptide repeat protein [Acidobacteriota bacterium]